MALKFEGRVKLSMTEDSENCLIKKAVIIWSKSQVSLRQQSAGWQQVLGERGSCFLHLNLVLVPIYQVTPNIETTHESLKKYLAQRVCFYNENFM